MLNPTPLPLEIFPVLRILFEGEHKPLEVKSVEMEARIHGALAETRMTVTFYNPWELETEGELNFPLPEGATVSGYALDINGTMVDGAVVEKHKGREVYEKIVRENLDPGLVEMTAGNNFKTRVFPIPALGFRTVMVRYVSSLVDGKNGLLYSIPLRFPEKVAEFRLRVEVVRPPDAPQVSQGGPSGFAFKPWRDGFLAETRLKDTQLNQDLDVEIELPRVARKPVQVETASDGRDYFLIHHAPPVQETTVQKTTAQKTAEPKPIERVAVYWDASGSRQDSDTKRAILFLKAFFEKHRDREIQADLSVFRNEMEQVESFRVQKGDAGLLIAACREVSYDGGTSIGALLDPPPGTDCVLLFTDGLSNFGREDMGEMSVPYFIFCGDAGANHAFLRSLALSTGGEYFNLAVLDDETVIEGMGREPLRFLGAEYTSGHVTESYPKPRHPVSGRFAFAGKLNRKSAKVILNFGTGSQVTHTEEFTVSSSDASPGDLMRTAWAQKKLDDLLIQPKKNSKAIAELGKEHGLVTPGTSLIVLEDIGQYIEHRIEPPASLPELRARYHEAAGRQEAEAIQENQAKIETLLSLWNARVSWWETRFDYPPDFQCDEDGNIGGEMEEQLGEEMGSGGEPDAEPEFASFSRHGGTEGDGLESTFAMPDEEFDAGEMRSAMTGAPAMNEAMAPESDGLEDPGGPPGDPTGPSIQVKAWNPDVPYLEKLREARPGEEYQVYLSQRNEYRESPGFFLDAGDFFDEKGDRGLALRVWSNIAELELENAAMLRILAHRLAQAEELELALPLFEEALNIRPEEPQSHRDLALVLGRLGEYGRAIELLHAVVMGEWDDRFPEIELIALMELNAMLPKAKEAGEKINPLDPRLARLLDLDLRIILTWDADLSDMDLWVIEPSGEKSYYGHPDTRIGGHLSKDFTQGYGPEEYIIKNAMRGDYDIKVNFFADHAPALAGTVTLQVDIFTNYGRVDEERKSITVRLRENKETLDVGQVSF